MPLLTLSPAGLTSQNGEAYLLPCQGLQALEHILSSTLSEPNPPPQPVVAVINVPDKVRYLADKQGAGVRACMVCHGVGSIGSTCVRCVGMRS